MANILVTGAAGFIGFHLSRRLLDRGDNVIGLDNLNDYYDVNLKHARLRILQQYPRFRFAKLDLQDTAGVEQVFRDGSINFVVNLAAQAGVRYSLENPRSYVDSNLVGFLNILECCRHYPVEHLVYASSSSVYGANDKLPFSVDDPVDHPVSLYAATKKANELMAHCYSHLYKIPTTGLRFFTVYGPWGRPDMAMWIFAKAIFAGQPIKLFNNGNMRRDFTYVDDVVESVSRLIDRPATVDRQFSSASPDPGSSSAPWRVYNIGSNKPVELLEVVGLLEEAIGKKAKRELLPMQLGDVPATYANVDELMHEVDFRPRTSIAEGIGRFIEWYRSYHCL